MTRASRSVSDRHKLLLLKAPGIFTYLTLGLFLDPEQPGGQNGLHPVPVEVQSVWQRNVTETLQQLALFPSGREALLAEPSVVEALRAEGSWIVIGWVMGNYFDCLLYLLII